MSTNLPPIPQDPIGESFKWREWLRNLGNYIQTAQSGGSVWSILQGGTGANTASGARNNLGLSDMAVQSSNDVNITGGTMDNVILGTGCTVPWETLVNEPYLEVAETSATISLTTTPQVLTPSTTVASNNINYDSSTGVFTFPIAGTYSQLIAVNAVASSANQYVYIYAENWNGTSWVVNTNSGKQQVLVNNNITQITLPNPVRRTAGQKVRYMIYSNGSSVQLQTTTLPGTTAIVPAIRIQYAG